MAANASVLLHLCNPATPLVLAIVYMGGGGVGYPCPCPSTNSGYWVYGTRCLTVVVVQQMYITLSLLCQNKTSQLKIQKWSASSDLKFSTNESQASCSVPLSGCSGQTIHCVHMFVGLLRFSTGGVDLFHAHRYVE